MALIEQAIYERLTTYAGLAALVGARVYPVILPQSPALPAVTYTKVTNEHVQSHGGASGLAMPRFQVDSWATTYASAKAVAEQVRLALLGFRGAVAGVLIGGVLAETETDVYEPETRIYRVSQDYRIAHEEAVPA